MVTNICWLIFVNKSQKINLWEISNQIVTKLKKKSSCDKTKWNQTVTKCKKSICVGIIVTVVVVRVVILPDLVKTTWQLNTITDETFSVQLFAIFAMFF